MKLVQKMDPEREYLGVKFPKGKVVKLPDDFPPDHAQHLLDWGWERVDAPKPDPEPEPVVTTALSEDDEVPSEQEESLPSPPPRSRGSRR